MNEKLIDMHTHTTFSDGELNPDELIDLAIKKNIGILAITDHNTTNGLKGLDKERYKEKIKIVNGIELSAHCDGDGRMHILGYDIDPFNENLNNKMKDQENYSINKVVTIMEQLKRDYNITFQKEDYINIVNAKHSIGRPDIASLCIKYGYAKNENEAFDKYLNPAYFKTKDLNKRLSYEECFDIIKQSGGIPVLAHPKSLKLENDKFLELLPNMIACGLEGIEAYHSRFSKEDMDFYTNVALDNNLLISGGSDFHGPTKKPEIELGSGINNNLNLRELSLTRKLK